jgi:integrase
MALKDLTPKWVNRYRADLLASGIREPTVRQALTVSQSVLTLAVTEDEIAVNPVARVRKPGMAPTRQHVPVPVPVIERMRAGLEERDRALISVLAYAGLRPQEALALRFEDIGTRTVHVSRKNVDGEILPYTKTRVARSVRLARPSQGRP